MNRLLLRITFLVLFFIVFLVAQTNVNGPGSGYTNAPSESSCTGTSGCHGGSLVTTGTKYDKIALEGNFTGGGYIPDSSYTLYVTYKEAGKSKWGFQITVLDEQGNPLTTTGSVPTLTNGDSRSQSYSYSINSQTRKSVGHTNSGTSSVSTDSVAWKVTWKAPKDNVGNVVFYLTLNVADGNGQNTNDIIYAKKFVIPPSSLLPVAKISVSDTWRCANLPVNYTAANSTGSPTKWAWSFPSGSISSSTLESPKVSYSSPGTYKAMLTVSNNKGKSRTDTFTISIKQGAAKPDIKVGSNTTPVSSASICGGDSLRLKPLNPTANNTLHWSPDGQTTDSIYVKDSGVYVLRTNLISNGCYRISNPVTIKVNPTPKVFIIKSFSGDSICSGAPFSLGSLVFSGPADSFSFVSKTGPYKKSDTMNSSLISGSATYSVWAKTTKGCVSDASSVLLHAKMPESAPVLNASDISFTGFRVNWQVISNAINYRVSIDSGKTFITPSTGDSGLYHDVSGLLGNHKMKVLVYATVPGICGQTEIGEIIVSTLSCSSQQPFDIEVTGSNKACLNSTVQVVLHKLDGKTIGVKIDGVFYGSDTMLSINMLGSRPYDISVIDSAALMCGYGTQSVMLHEDTIADPITSPDGNIGLCSSGSTATLALNVNAHSSIDSLFYYQNNSLEASGTGFSHNYSVSTGDSVWVVAQNKSGCKSPESMHQMVTVNAYPNAAFNVSNNDFDYTFTAQDANGTHSWKIGTDSVDAPSVQLDMTAYKDDSVLVSHYITKNGCTSLEVRKLFIPDFAGVRLKNIPGARIYPNPATDKLFVQIPQTKDARAEIYTTTSELVISAILKQGSNEIITETLSGGTYLFRIISGNKETTGSILIER